MSLLSYVLKSKVLTMLQVQLMLGFINVRSEKEVYKSTFERLNTVQRKTWLKTQFNAESEA
jgi:hypothetical protein